VAGRLASLTFLLLCNSQISQSLVICQVRLLAVVLRNSDIQVRVCIIEGVNHL
jgi:hypothetical protein